jgi:predicted GNAT family acetyltransferase
MADYIGATPQVNPLMGLLSERLKQAQGFAAKPFGYQNPPAEMLMNLLGIPAIQQTAERIAYDEPLTTGSGMTTQIRPEVMEAAMTLAPTVGLLGRGVERGAMAAGRAGERYAEKVVPQIMERGGMPAQLLGDLSQGSIRPMDVWHGSPHGPFDRFDPSKARTGEGNATFGEGAYLAQARGTGETYKDALTKGENYVNGELLDTYKPEHYLASILDQESGNLSETAGFLKDMVTKGGSPSIKQTAKEALSLLESGKRPKVDYVKPSGYLYKVDLPDESIAKMLDYDKPLSQQAPEVQNALAELGISVDKKKMGEYEDALLDALTNPNSTGKLPKQPLDLTGEQILKELERNASRYFPNAMEGKELTAAMINPRAGVSELLAKKGVPGVRYLDQMSRDAGEGTSNFVVFPKYQDLLTIKEINDKPVGGLLGQAKAAFDVSRKDASDIFGAGAERVMYKDPKSGGTLEVLAKPDGTASVLSLEVPETSRGKGIGQSLQAQVMQDFPEMMGQVSSKAAAKTAYRLGRRPAFNPEATLEDVYKMMDEDSSVNLVSPDMQKRFGQRTNLLD